MRKTIGFLFLIFLLQSCIDPNPNVNEQGEDILEVNKIFLDSADIAFRDTVYIPIYSDIYSQSIYIKYNLTATLSIRNTSLRDSIYIEDIDYYDSEGERVRRYLNDVLLVKPMQTIEYVIAEDDNVGGTGANFIVNWGANTTNVKPLFQGVMISTHGQQGISFVTEGVSISEQTELEVQ